MTASRRPIHCSILFIATAAAVTLLFFAMLTSGHVRIPVVDVAAILCGGVPEVEAWRAIILESRLPMAITALLSGACLGVAGLLLQTVFRNPLAGPSILGISSGASLGVALVMLAVAAIPAIPAGMLTFGAFIGAMAGAAVILLILSVFSTILRNTLSLLIVGIMVSYIASAVISILNVLAPAEAVRSFVVWGLGSYAGVAITDVPVFAAVSAVLLIPTVLCAKPLNAMLLGDRYLRTMGYRVNTIRTLIMTIAGVLTAVVTAYCGPIGFIGLIVPHVARMIYDTSNHFILIPATILTGAVVSLLCAWISVLPITSGVLPINAVTPIAGVPVILYIILNTKRLKYFN